MTGPRWPPAARFAGMSDGLYRGQAGLLDRGAEVGEGGAVVVGADVFDDQGRGGCVAGGEGDEFYVVERAEAGGDAALDVEFTVFGVEAVDAGPELLKHFFEVVHLYEIRGIEEGADAG